jgi:plasmid stabilization system protein ParE
LVNLTVSCGYLFVRRTPGSDGAVGIVTILHERMHPPSRLKTDFGD